MEKNKILVTGGSGMVGQALQKIMPPSEDVIYVSSKDYNLMIYEETEKMFKTIKPNIVIHLAAKVGGLYYNMQNPVGQIMTNLAINDNLLRCALDCCHLNRLLALSSTCAYPEKYNKAGGENSNFLSVRYHNDSAPHLWHKEEDRYSGPPPNSNFEYGMAKRAMTATIDAAVKEGCKWGYIIPSNIYGPGDNFTEISSHFMGMLFRKIREARERKTGTIVLPGSADVWRQLLYVDDVAKLIKRMVEADIYSVFNIAHPAPINYKNVVREAIALNFIPSGTKTYWDGAKAAGQKSKNANNQKLYDSGLFRADEFTDIGTGMKATFDWYMSRSADGSITELSSSGKFPGF